MYNISLANPWMEPGKLGPNRGHAAVATCRPFSGRGVTENTQIDLRNKVYVDNKPSFPDPSPEKNYIIEIL